MNTLDPPFSHHDNGMFHCNTRIHGRDASSGYIYPQARGSGISFPYKHNPSQPGVAQMISGQSAYSNQGIGNHFHPPRDPRQSTTTASGRADASTAMDHRHHTHPNQCLHARSSSNMNRKNNGYVGDPRKRAARRHGPMRDPGEREIQVKVTVKETYVAPVVVKVQLGASSCFNNQQGASHQKSTQQATHEDSIISRARDHASQSGKNQSSSGKQEDEDDDDDDLFETTDDEKDKQSSNGDDDCAKATGHEVDDDEDLFASDDESTSNTEDACNQHNAAAKNTDQGTSTSDDKPDKVTMRKVDVADDKETQEGAVPGETIATRLSAETASRQSESSSLSQSVKPDRSQKLSKQDTLNTAMLDSTVTATASAASESSTAAETASARSAEAASSNTNNTNMRKHHLTEPSSPERPCKRRTHARLDSRASEREITEQEFLSEDELVRREKDMGNKDFRIGENQFLTTKGIPTQQQKLKGEKASASGPCVACKPIQFEDEDGKIWHFKCCGPGRKCPRHDKVLCTDDCSQSDGSKNVVCMNCLPPKKSPRAGVKRIGKGDHVGVFARTCLPEGAFVEEYTGVVTTLCHWEQQSQAEEARRTQNLQVLLEAEASQQASGNCLQDGDRLARAIEHARAAVHRCRSYASAMNINKQNYAVDAATVGSIARYANHSCNEIYGQNCELKEVKSNGRKLLGLMTTKEVAAGEELKFDYKWYSDREEDLKVPCWCGCNGSLYKPLQEQPKEGVETRSSKRLQQQMEK